MDIDVQNEQDGQTEQNLHSEQITTKYAGISSLLSKLRDAGRENLRKKRILQRNEDVDSLRIAAGQINNYLQESTLITPKDISGMAVRIKRRRRAEEADINRLSKAFLQNELNSITFVNIPGALDVLIKELIGNSDTE